MAMTATSVANHTNCYTPMPAASNGILQGDIPIHFSLPLLTMQIVVVLVVTRSMAFVLKPLKQPRVLAEIIGGVLLGPTALGRNKAYMDNLFPRQSLQLLDTVATMGLMFFIFMVGLKLDMKMLMKKSGKEAMLLASIGIAVPFAASTGLAGIVLRTIGQGLRIGPLIVFMGIPLSISAFSVLVRIMAEVKLLGTEVGKIGIAAAAVNDVMVWILLAVGVAMAGTKGGPLVPLWVLLLGIGYGIIVLTIVRKVMEAVAATASSRVSEGKSAESFVCGTLVGVLVAGFCSDSIGVHSLLGPFLLGLVVPKDGEFPTMVTHKIDDFVTGILLPLFFASSGLKTNLAILHGTSSLAFLLLFFATAAIGKILSTFAAARLLLKHQLSARHALILGVLMNTKGLGVLIVLNVGKDNKALNDETFAILVVTCLLTTIVTTPIVKALHKPKNNMDVEHDSQHEQRTVEAINMSQKQLRILACGCDNNHFKTMTNLLEALRGMKINSMKIYTLRLLQMLDEPSALLTYAQVVHDPQKRMANALTNESIIEPSFHNVTHLSKVEMKPLFAISDIESMHEDICAIAKNKKTHIIILPHHEPPLARIESCLTHVNLKVLNQAPCSVGILAERSPKGSAMPIHPSFFSFNVVAIFVGGRDDREALAIARRVAHHPGVTLKLVRFIIESHENDGQKLERQLDDEAISKVKQLATQNSWSTFVYEENPITAISKESLIEATQKEANNNHVDMFMVGRCSQQLSKFKEHGETRLGFIGDVLLSIKSEFSSCILAIQHQSEALANTLLKKTAKDF